MPLTSPEQRRLLELASSGSRSERDSAYRALLDDFRRPAMSVICRTLRAAELAGHAEEVWQQTVYKFFTVGAKTFRGQSSVRTYFVRSALHAAIDMVRLASKTRRLDEREISTGAGNWRPVSTEAELSLIDALRSCVQELTGDHAEAVDLYYIQEKGSCSACAAQLGVSTEAFMKRLERARRRIEACIRRRLADAS